MDRFKTIRERLVMLARQSIDVSAVIVIGSQARENERADEHSDLDIILVCARPDEFLHSDTRIGSLGRIMISFTEPTVGGAEERRLLLDDGSDIDLIVLSEEQFIYMAEHHIADVIFSRGYTVLYDRSGICGKLTFSAEILSCENHMNESDFINTVNDFWFHTVWTAKKIKRGELWTAITCLDGYLKHKLLRMIELSETCRHGGGYDTWHNGRLMEKWADTETLVELKDCFARYERNEIAAALERTADLYAKLAVFCAEATGYSYPAQAESFARGLYQNILNH